MKVWTIRVWNKSQLRFEEQPGNEAIAQTISRDMQTTVNVYCNGVLVSGWVNGWVSC